MHDLVIRGGLLVDGTGGPRRRADVAIDGDVITAVGGEVGAGRREIDADGLIVTPGWVDSHTHFDAQATWDPELTPSGWHGVTTVVMGNCGVGFAPADPAKRDWLIAVMEGVEDIPGAALTDGIQWDWETFPEYLDALDKHRWVADIGTQMPHVALRGYVMGDRAADDQGATAADLAEMARLTTEALRAGALGFSTSRTPLHKDNAGNLVPGTFAPTDELFAIAEAIADAGHGVFQCALHHPDVPESADWLRQVAKITGQPVIFNLNQPDEHPDLWREELDILEAAQAEGLDLLAQVAGRPVGILECWDGTANPFVPRPAAWELAELSRNDRLAALKRPETRQALCDSEPIELSRFETFVTSGWHKMYPFDGETDYEPEQSQSVAAIAERTGRRPVEIAYDQLMADDGNGLLYFPLFNYANGDLDHLWELHQHPYTRMGLADAGAHCGAICDGGMPTFMVSFWTRDRTRGERLPLEHIVFRQTKQTAELYGLLDRGVVAPGYRADLNVIDYDNLTFEAPRMAWDLPTSARRFVQKAKGYRYSLCAGTVTVQDDTFTGDHPGRLVRGPRQAPTR
jgi:N-acyl-D-aspartate/D-glutamate deacylase